jgi:hypothetical protein
MDRIVICQHLPCLLHPVIQIQETTPRWERATPFLIGILILLLSIVTTRAVVEKAEARMTEGWTPDTLREAGIDPARSPNTQVLGLAWVVDVAQIPALLGTPLVGLFILKHHIVILLYTAVMIAGMIVFLIFYLMKEITDYDRLNIKYRGFRVSIITGGAILVNTLCAVLAVVK